MERKIADDTLHLLLEDYGLMDLNEMTDVLDDCDGITEGDVWFECNEMKPLFSRSAVTDSQLSELPTLKDHLIPSLIKTFTEKSESAEAVAKFLEENGFSDTELFANPDFASAVIAVTTDGVVVYDIERMITSYAENGFDTEEDAWEFIYYNTLGSLGNDPHKPMVVSVHHPD